MAAESLEVVVPLHDVDGLFAEVHALSDDLKRIFNASGCTNVDDVLACIKGLQERVKFTANYESLQYELWLGKKAYANGQ